jgi:hypothetical protein
MISFLKSKGFEPSIIPGRTNLQTNFVVRDKGHLAATLDYYIQTLAAIEAWPKMYTDGQLNPFYQQLVSKDFDIVMMMRQLDAMGIDCRSLISSVAAEVAKAMGSEDTSLDMTTMTMLVMEAVQKAGYTPQELAEMSEDSGLDVSKLIFDLYTYFTEQPEEEDDTTPEGQTQPASARRAARLIKAFDNSATPAMRNEQQLRQWLGDYLK